MTAPLPTGPVGAPDVDDDALSWLLSSDPTVIAVLGGVMVTLLVITALAGWLVLRRVRRSQPVVRGRELASRGRELGMQGATAVAARRLPPGHRRSSAELQLEIARARDRLRHQVATAQAAGAYLGDVPDLLPSLTAEGSRLEQRLRLRALVPDPTDRADPEPEARAYLAMIADVCDAAHEAERVASAAGRATTDVADAVAGLRAHTTAYQELTAPPMVPRLPPVPSPPPEPTTREATQS